MSRICPVCGKVNPASTGHCDVCGTPLSSVESLPALAVATSDPLGPGMLGAHQPMSGPICPVCRRGNRSHSAFCAYCGYRLKPANGHAGSGPNVHAQAYAAPSALASSFPAPPTAPIVPADISGNIPAGVVLKRRYSILRKIAQGGMGAVYESVDVTQNDGRRWAVKEMSPAALPASERTQAIADFRREALILHGLKHPNLPEVRETFEEMSKHFLVMEFIAGRTLLNVVDTSPGFIHEERLLVWARQLLEVLHYLHSQDPPIIYRDVKPANVMLMEGTERIKLIDFGIARFHRPGKVQDTEAFGTAGYAPPEQYGKGQTDQRSDIYALGATLHHLATRQDPSLNPFNWVPARRSNPNITPALENAIMVATSLDPSRRYRNIEEFARALGVFLPDGLGLSRPTVSGISVPIFTDASGMSHTPRPNVVSTPPPLPAPTATPLSTPTSTVASAQKPKSSSRKKSTPKAAPSPLPVIVSEASGTVIDSFELASPTATGMVADPTASGAQVVAAAASTSTSAPAPAPAKELTVAATGPRLVLPQPVLDLGDARWNTRLARRIPLTSSGGPMRGMVVATQPWIAYNPQHFQGTAVTLDVQVKKRQLRFGRLELHVPNLFAIIWARTRRVLPFVFFWFWLLVLVVNSLGRTLITGLAVAVGTLLVLEGLMWLWAQHVKFFVPTEKLNTGRLMVKSTGGDQSIEVRVMARPSWVQRALGWTLALSLFVAEITLITWAVLSFFGIRLPFVPIEPGPL